MRENIAFVVVLLLALYGIACLLHRFTLKILMPTEKIPTFMLTFIRKDTENVEQLIRYFRAKADKNDVLLLVDNGATKEQKDVIQMLCQGRRDVRFLTAEKFVEENCICDSDTI